MHIPSETEASGGRYAGHQSLMDLESAWFTRAPARVPGKSSTVHVGTFAAVLRKTSFEHMRQSVNF